MRRKEMYKSSEKEKLGSEQYFGKKEAGVYGRGSCMGIPEYDVEAEKAGLTPLKNRFSAQHDVSMSEAMRMVKGRGTSDQTEKMNDTD